uniref:Uncharacterized protein n=1 Tax=Sipha flava TaxID=143950 RepID=A0A2S2QZT4_9HEMI
MVTYYFRFRSELAYQSGTSDSSHRRVHWPPRVHTSSSVVAIIGVQNCTYSRRRSVEERERERERGREKNIYTSREIVRREYNVEVNFVGSRSIDGRARTLAFL